MAAESDDDLPADTIVWIGRSIRLAEGALIMSATSGTGMAGAESGGAVRGGNGPALSVIVYSQRPQMRAAIRSAVGRRPAADVARLDWIECEHYGEVRTELDAGEVDLAIFDGDAQPTGGMGLARQFKNEITNCPPIIVVVAREQDRWLASWSLADAVIVAPVDPVTAAAAVAQTLRDRAAVIPMVR